GRLEGQTRARLGASYPDGGRPRHDHRLVPEEPGVVGEAALDAGGADHRQGREDCCPLIGPPAVSPSTAAPPYGRRSCPSISPAWRRKRKPRSSTRCGPGG